MRYHRQAPLFRRDSCLSILASAALVALLLHSGIGNVRLPIGAYAYEVCGNVSSYCPSKNTCCPIHHEADHKTLLDDLKHNETLLWGCIPSDMGARNATCCNNDDGIRHGSGCPAGYHCRKRQDKQGTDGDAISNSSYDCVRSPDAHSKDPFTKVLPRYRLCPAEDNPPRLYGINVGKVRMPPIEWALSKVNSTTTTARLAYYSNQGPITQSWLSERVLIVIHGANRNADDYFCSAKSTLFLQDRYPPLSIMVIAPLFLESPLEDDHNDDTTTNYLYWAKPNTPNRDDGTWRYGADATGPIQGISSFDAMDTLIHRLKDKRYFPNLRKIVVVGHSSGGQFVNRWSILTDVWPNIEANNKDDGIKLHAVVANPSSYVYLTPLRFASEPVNRWKTVPYKDCPQYNQWEWGLDDGGPLDVPYRQRAFAKTNTSDMIDRYLNHRSVVYLVGNLDRCSYGSRSNKYKKDDALLPTPPCDSHGLETTCADQLQGNNRYERNLRYWASLGKVNADTIHHQMIVPDVGHDHTMMFQSREGIRAIYHTPKKRKRVDAGRSDIT